MSLKDGRAFTKAKCGSAPSPSASSAVIRHICMSKRFRPNNIRAHLRHKPEMRSDIQQE